MAFIKFRGILHRSNDLAGPQQFSRSRLAIFGLLFATLGGSYALYVSFAATTPTITFSYPATGAACSTRFDSQDVYPGNYDAMAQASSGPSTTQRMDALGLDVYRVQAVSDATYFSNGVAQGLDIPFPVSYTATNGTVQPWDFSVLDKVLSDGPAGAPRLLDITRPPDSFFTGTGTLGGSSGATPGAIADQTYNSYAQYMANVVRYFRTGNLVTDSGSSVTYTATSLTDTAQNFTAYGTGGYSVTATVLDSNGFRDWETAAITSITNSGHTLNFSAGWSISNSSSLTSKSTPAAGAAYDLAATTPPITSPINAHPWPMPPSVGNVLYFETANEPDLSNWDFPRTSPSLPAPAPTLSGVNVTGGTLTPGATYSYRITAVSVAATESLPGTEATITLPAGDNAVQVNWGATSNLGLSPYAYRIYGRTTAAEKAMVVVGRDASSGLTWTDKGSVAPSGALPTADNTAGLQILRARDYVKMWNAIAPAMKAVDGSIKLVGPVISNAASLASETVDTTVVTTGPSDSSWKDFTDYVQRLMSDGTPKPDIIDFHAYGGWQGSADTDASYWNAAAIQQQINDFNSVDKPYIGSTPAWITETNLDAGGLDTNDFRAMTQLGSAFMADDLIKWCTQAPEVTGLFHFEAQNGNTWALYDGATPPANCYPQPACSNESTGNPNLEYWLIYEMSRYFPVGSKIAPVSGVPAGYAAMAIQPPGSSKVNIVVVNEQTGASPGVGTAGTVAVQLAGATVSDTQQVVVDGATSPVNGPIVADLGAQSSVTLNMNGYAVAILSFTTNNGSSDTTPPTVPTNVTAGTATTTSIPITWTASTDNVGVTGYTLYNNGAAVGTTVSTGYTFTGLVCGTSYTLGVDAYDAANNHSSTASISASTATCPAPDTTPPSVPANVRVTGTTNSTASLSWNASSDNVGGSGLAGYKVYRNGTLVATVTAGAGTSYTDTGLAASTTYTYTVSAYDNSANESAQSTAVSATTSANSPPASVPGDCNGDGHVNIIDLSILLSHYGQAYTAGDFNHDGTVNVFDLSILLSNYGR